MFDLSPLPRQNANDALHLWLPPEKEQFVAPISELIADPNPAVDFHVARLDGEIIGFFKVQGDYSAEHDFASDRAYGLRAVMIDERHTGKGLGRAFFDALPDYLRAHYPHMTEIFLTVNIKNPRARHVYLTGGWIDTGDLYLGGDMGPQHIMSLKVR